MDYQDYVELGLKDDGNLKVILKGGVERARQKLEELTAKQAEGDYYMVYSCPLDTDLSALGHYPSIEIAKADLL